jgi:hypothetical protein
VGCTAGTGPLASSGGVTRQDVALPDLQSLVDCTTSPPPLLLAALLRWDFARRAALVERTCLRCCLVSNLGKGEDILIV